MVLMCSFPQNQFYETLCPDLESRRAAFDVASSLTLNLARNMANETSEKRKITGIALVEVVQVTQKKGLLGRVFSGKEDFKVQVKVLKTIGQADLPETLELPATANHDEKVHFVLFVSGSDVVDSDPFVKERVQTIDPFKQADGKSDYYKTGLLSFRMAADLWIGKQMPYIPEKSRL